MTIDPGCINDAPHIAERHGRMVACAMLSGEKAKAIAAVERGFQMLAELKTDRLTYDDDICLVVRDRMATILNGGGIFTIGDLCSHSRDSLVQIHQIRYRSVDIIERELQRRGLSLARA